MAQTATRLMTIMDLAALPSETPSGPVLHELWEGVLHTTAPPGDEHGGVENAFAEVLRSLGQRRGHGRARCGEVAIVLARDPDTVVGADAVFIAKDQLPVRRSREGYLETIPAIIVEVRSKNDTRTEIEEKVAAYLAAGARLVWVADPPRETVTAHRPGQAPVELGVGDALTTDGIIPGFAVDVSELFEELD